MTLRAVIVDDNAEFLATASRLLEQQGISVVAVASNAADALGSVLEHNPDVVLVDVHLGEENGLDVAERLSSRRGRGSPVVLISADADQDLEDLIRASTAIGFVSKTQLSANAIRQLLEGR
jgi:CheY-like chemotaxis protein